MSTNPYSIDLRTKVIKFIEEGNSQRLASKVFSLSKTTINAWHVRYKSEGHYRARKRIGAKASIDVKEFERYVREHPNKKASDIGKRFNLSTTGTRYWLKKLRFSYKKKPLPTWKQIKRKEKTI